MKIVLVHEWLTNLAGSEKVLLQMAQAFPRAEIIVGVADPALVEELLPQRSVKSLLSPALPGILTRWSRYAPLLWFAWRFHKIDADIILISSHFGTHQVCHRATGKTVVYYHTPMRMAWKFEMEKARVSILSRIFIRLLLPIIQHFDRLPAKKATRRLANSTETQNRIRNFYGCDSEILHPPVDTLQSADRQLDQAKSNYYLCFGRLVDYKRVDQAILACNELGRRLVIAGTGPAEKYLRELAGPTIEFVGKVDEKTKANLLSDAKALIFPGLEDFGIVPVEAMSLGTPVIAFGRGGVLDSLTPKSGVLYCEDDTASLAAAIREFESNFYNSAEITQHASRFNEARFRQKLLDIVQETCASAGSRGSS